MHDLINKCECGSQPKVVSVAMTGDIVKCPCGAQTFPVSGSRGAAISKWNYNHKGVAWKI